MIFRDPSFIDNSIIKRRLERYASQEDIDSFNNHLTKKVKARELKQSLNPRKFVLH